MQTQQFIMTKILKHKVLICGLKQISWVFHKLKSFGHRSSSTTTNRTNFKAGETVDEKLKSLFSETTIEDNNLKEIVEQRPKRRVTIQEKKILFSPIIMNVNHQPGLEEILLAN